MHDIPAARRLVSAWNYYRNGGNQRHEDPALLRLFNRSFSEFVQALPGSELMQHTHFRPQWEYVVELNGAAPTMLVDNVFRLVQAGTHGGFLWAHSISGSAWARDAIKCCETLTCHGFRFEDFPQNIAGFFKTHGIQHKVPHLRASPEVDRSALYDVATEKVVQELYATDFKMFKYDAHWTTWHA